MKLSDSMNSFYVSLVHNYVFILYTCSILKIEGVTSKCFWSVRFGFDKMQCFSYDEQTYKEAI